MVFTQLKPLIGTGSDNFILANALEVSESIQSYHISGSTIDNNDYIFTNFYFSGSTMPSSGFTYNFINCTITNNIIKGYYR